MHKKLPTIIAVLFLAFPILFLSTFIFSSKAFAGIGVSPASIDNDHAKPGTQFDQIVTVSRSDATSPVDITIETDATSEIASWISFTPGTSLTLAAGENSKDFTVTIAIPDDAELKAYTGYIRIKTTADSGGDAIGVVKGARIDVNIDLTDSDYVELVVRRLEIPLLYQNEQLSLTMTVENNGNAAASPSKVKIVITDLNDAEVATLETTEITSVEPNSTQDITLTFDHTLQPGEYFAQTTAYYGEEVLRDELLSFEVRAGTRPATTTNTGNWLQNLSSSTIMIAAIVGGLALLLIIFSVFMLMKKGKRQEPTNGTPTPKPTEPVTPSEPSSAPASQSTISPNVETTAPVQEATVPEAPAASSAPATPTPTEVKNETKPEQTTNSGDASGIIAPQSGNFGDPAGLLGKAPKSSTSNTAAPTTPSTPAVQQEPANTPTPEQGTSI